MKQLINATGLTVLALLVSSCVSHKNKSSDASHTDAYSYLMDVQSKKSLQKVNEMNAPTLNELEGDPRYKAVESEIAEILQSKDRIPKIEVRGGYVYNLWQDPDHVKGLWRRAPVKTYQSNAPQWETLIDMDAIAQSEKENWVFKNAVCLDDQLCMLELSRGGKDATVVREFNLKSREFVKNGFYLPEAKTQVAWVNENELHVATDFGKGTLTDSGYAKSVRSLKRGDKLSSAVLLVDGAQADMGAYPIQLEHSGRHLNLVMRRMSFRTSEYSLVLGGTQKKWNLPIDFELLGFFKNDVVGSLRSDLKVKNKIWAKGSLVGYTVADNGDLGSPLLIFSPDSRSALSDIQITSDAIYANVLKDVTSQVLQFKKNKTTYKSVTLNTPKLESITLMPTEGRDPELFFISEGFLKPSALYSIESGKVKKIYALNSKFRTDGMVVKQIFALSTDGTKIPYFWIGPKQVKRPIPTLQYGYGGFEIPEVPFYWAVAGKAWLERGGALVVTNIRGGGEYGPRWHQAALREKRQVAFDDFASIARDLIAKKLTTSAQLGIMGGSNGGLLVGTSFVQQPKLFGAVVCAVPLLDMLTFHRYLAGASWMEEYGNPDTSDAQYIARYSPYQNVKQDVKYPEVFFVTSTLDDRVHPGHARKMAAKMKDMGHKIYYFENTEGGHAASSNLKQKARIQALEYVYLMRKLM